ncbi:MAG TPA: LPS export ABC transporter permease LptG [Xanthomonadaceae bacterium]|nr:LPS export ABC transporter permease LptG [Xanthomonadaceae bacterium]
MIALAVHQRLIGRSVLLAVLATWLVLTGFAMIGALLNQIDDLGQGEYNLATALLHLALQVPRRAYENFPMGAVIGAVLALGGHAARSELVALRAAGLSPWRIAAVTLAVVAALVLPLMLAMESVVPGMERRAHVLKLEAMQRDVSLAGGGEVWAREGHEVFNARGGARRSVEGRTVLVFEGVTVHAFDPHGRLAWIQEAAEAEYDEQRGWLLRDVRRTSFDARSVAVERFDQQVWASALKPGVIEASLQRPDHLATRAIGAQIDQLTRNALDAATLREAYWGRLTYPLTTLALVFAAIPFAFGQRRSGGFGQRLFVGIVFALVARLLQPMLVNLAKAYGLSIALAYIVPALALVALGAWWLRRR